MDIENLKHQFARIGAQLEVEFLTNQLRQRSDFWLDVRIHKQDELFILSVQEKVRDSLELHVVDSRPEQRHLLLLSKNRTAAINDQKSKFLCGHDERHWFVAGVPSAGITTVREAFESLKPSAAITSQWQRQVKPKNRNKRHNAGFIRQGEWFFIPRLDFEVDNPVQILRNEPLQRGGGKAHVLEQAYRFGGAIVYVSFKYPNGLTQRNYNQLLQRNPSARKIKWQIMQRDPTVYARGKVRHPDHKTIVLPFWHQVLLNSEVVSQEVAFLD